MSLRRLTANDLFRISSRKITDEGYLVAPGVLARTGVQVYRARELGLDGGDKEVRLYRPPEEVFAEDSVLSFEGKPITMDHPPTDVVADNWRKYAVGDVRDVKHENGLMTGTLIIRDKAAVRAVLDGKCALSNGYSFDFDPTPGKAPDGSAYDAVQRQVRGNHTAIVDTARGGPACRIGDHEPGDRPMAMIKLALDGISIELEETQASIVNKLVGDAKKGEKTATEAVATAEKRAKDAETALKTATDAATKAATDHAAKVTELEGKVLKPEQVQALVVERTKLVGDAAKLAPEYKPEAKAPELIRAEVLAEVVAKDEALKPIVAAILKGAEPAKAEPALVTAAFDAAVAAKGTTTTTDAATREADRIVAGKFAASDGKSTGKLTGRALFMARQQNPSFQQDDAE
jgi:hypothetical protein